MHTTMTFCDGIGKDYGSLFQLKLALVIKKKCLLFMNSQVRYKLTMNIGNKLFDCLLTFKVVRKFSQNLIESETLWLNSNLTLQLGLKALCRFLGNNKLSLKSEYFSNPDILFMLRTRLFWYYSNLMSSFVYLLV